MPRSSAFSTPTASASMAMSCVAAKMLWMMMSVVISAMPASTPTKWMASSEITMHSCIDRIQPRRLPNRSEATTSTIGPISHLNAHGRYMAPTKALMAPAPTPSRRIWVASATAAKPSGTPSVM